jgi:pyruvate dehydrogenase E2 component (dihydrolipoamide acetyltransferase)
MSTEVQKLGMPKWGLSMTEGRLVGWLVDEGTEVAVGDEVAEVETEKLHAVARPPPTGAPRGLVAAEGDVIAVGGLLGVIADAAVDDADVEAFIADFEATFVPGEAEEAAGAEP